MTMNIFKRSPPLTNSAQLIRELRSQYAKLKQIIFKLRKRDSSLFEMCTRAIEKEERERAKIYANELAQVRTMLNAVAQSELAIEIAVLRLENLTELHNLIADLKPTIRVVQSLTIPVAKVMPEITHVMEQLNSLVNDALIETRLDSSQLPLPLNVKSIEGKEILKEVSAHIEQKLEKELPEPPSFAVAPKEAIKSEEEREAIPIAVG